MSSDPAKYGPLSQKDIDTVKNSNSKNTYPLSDKDIDTLKKSLPDNSTKTTKTESTVKFGPRSKANKKGD
jgi:hypothetical protein|tara:strand:- start:251 stop:460 length:210 start_codon:yes stop_codon:yes gene_type:complete